MIAQQLSAIEPIREIKMTKKRLRDIMTILWTLSCVLIATNTILSERPVLSFILTTVICAAVLVAAWRIGRHRLTDPSA